MLTKLSAFVLLVTITSMVAAADGADGLLDLSERIRELILDKRPASEIKRAAKEEGMTFLRESAIEKAILGVTSLREINKVTFIE